MAASETDDRTERAGPLAPLGNRAFRLLWSTWLAANVCMWMNEMAAAWLMTSLTTSATTIALVQTAATLPVFLLSMPSGVVADLMDRRHILLLTQLWTAAVALLMAVVTWSGSMQPGLLLGLVVASGASLAMRGPAYVASVPEAVARGDWQKAFALGSVAGHGARLFGPVGAGLLIAAGGVVAVFVFNAAVATLISLVLWRSRLPQAAVQSPAAPALPREPFGTALRVGLQYVAHSARLKALLLRVLCFYGATVALLALLPAMVRQQWHGSATTYTTSFALVGAGAFLAMWLLPRLKARYGERQLLMLSVGAYAVALAGVSFAAGPWQAAPALVLAGVAWMSAGNQFTSSIQMALPSWVRARGMSIYHTSLMAGSAAGALVWGRVAEAAGLRGSLLGAGAATALLLLLVKATDRAVMQDEDVTADAFASLPGQHAGMAAGPVITTVEYVVAAAHHEEFARLMRATRRSRLGTGALQWKLLRDCADPCCFTEVFSDVSWDEMRRRMARAVAHDKSLRDRRHSLHAGPGKPRVRIFAQQAPGAPGVHPTSGPSPWLT